MAAMNSDKVGLTKRELVDDLSTLHYLSFNEEHLLAKVKEAVKRDPSLLYIYYTGHSDESGNWTPDGVTTITL